MKKIILIICIGFITIACEYITEVEDISNKSVTILAPTNNSVINTEAIFTWEALDDAENYHIQIATPSFENASQIVLDTLIEKTNQTKSLPIGSYEWRVRAENSEYVTIYTKQHFTVEE